jgi:hypothetical protein
MTHSKGFIHNLIMTTKGTYLDKIDMAYWVGFLCGVITLKLVLLGVLIWSI